MIRGAWRGRMAWTTGALAACLLLGDIPSVVAAPGTAAPDTASRPDSTATVASTDAVRTGDVPVGSDDGGASTVATETTPGGELDDRIPASAIPMVLAPLVTGTVPCLLVIALAYVVCWFGTDLVVPRLARDPRPRHLRERATGSDEAEPASVLTPEEQAQEIAAIKRLGRIIGKCENVLTVTFVIAGQGTGLAIIFTAKAIARQREIRSDSGYYLGGTLLNFTISVAIAQVARVLIAGLP